MCLARWEPRASAWRVRAGDAALRAQVRSLIPILQKNNISAVSVGVNNYSPAPFLPSPSQWTEPATGASTLYMQTGQGIGYPNVPGPSSLGSASLMMTRHRPTGSDPANPGGLSHNSCVTVPVSGAGSPRRE